MIITLRIDPHERAAAAIGLLVPEPPDTVHQTLVGFCAPCPLPYRIVRESRSGQRAYLFEGDFGASLEFSFHFAAGTGTVKTDEFADFDNAYTRLAGDLSEFLALERPACAAGHGDDDIVAAVARRFSYGGPNPDLARPATFCGVRSGNCIDINTALLACLRAAGRRAAYFAGFHFGRNRGGCRADGMHCWIATETAGRRCDWDVAHCLIAGLARPVAGLNPLGGVRAAFSHGRGLVFEAATTRLPAISHFARPRWLLADGSLPEAATSAVLTQPMRADAEIRHAARPPQTASWATRSV
ncbi:transglutaminase domain-containing protein [Nitratireductor sp. StC3]|uniref:transglutaminase domain-containing protein n=1 Tax=Nitratireductor sp. StC3 TaxID=2126741 RepID=UPI000D0CF5EB|nr:transglutaminase domain-containing protein [Nitratireductor sp. StC3]PSM19776.1 hypothetical protein C7T96_01465 [Nitratireductor sp. StC3]